MPELTQNERQILADDLRGVVSGQVFTSEIFSHLYSTDASLYQKSPAAIVRPVSVKDVVNCVNYAKENDFSIAPRGAGTGLAGESLTDGIILDFSQSMRKILKIEQESVSVQPGLVLGTLNRQLEKRGRLVGPDPSTRNVMTIGGLIAIDSSGSHFLKYGSARHKVLGLQVVLADGQVIETSEANFHSVEYNRFRKSEIVSELGQLATTHRDLIDAQPVAKMNSRSGYNLSDTFADPDRVDLNKLFCGSEGTLGIITAATLATDPRPPCRGVVLFFFERLDRAVEAISLIREQNPSACDMVDRRLLSITRETESELAGIIPSLAEVMILVEFDGDLEAEVSSKLNQLVRRVQRQKGLAFHSVASIDPLQRNRYWRIVRRVISRLSGLSGMEVSVPFVEDIAVPPEKLHAFIVASQKIFRSHRITSSMFAHAGHGQTHLRPFLDFSDGHLMRQNIKSISRELFDLVMEFGGTISGEHGDGLSRSYYLKRQFGEVYSIFRQVKKIFDPQFLLNPGKKVGKISHDPSDFLRKQMADPDLLPTALSTNALPILEPNLSWSVEELSRSVHACNGCGRCRTAQPHERMCPIFRMLPSEEASPRAKANLVRGILTGQISSQSVASDEFKQISDLCVNCHQCRLECPAEVDIPKMMLEAKSQYVLQNGLTVSQKLLSRLDLLCKLGSGFSQATNFLNGSRFFRWLLEKTIGVAQGRKLPKFERQSFLKRVTRRKHSAKAKTGSGVKVAYFVDAVPNWIDAELSQSFLQILEKNNIEVIIPSGQEFSGLSLISNGVVEKAMKVARKNVDLFADAIRSGYHVVTSEPAAALCLSHEYRNLLGDDEDTRLVAENTSEACHFLWDLHQKKKLNTEFQNIEGTVGYHWPCHQKALSSNPPGLELLKLIPGLKVVAIEKGCSGMAGTYGLLKENYRKSLRAGWDLISTLRHSDITIGATECSACKMQMEQGATKPTMHPLKVLAHAYGFLPDLARRMHLANSDRFISR